MRKENEQPLTYHLLPTEEASGLTFIGFENQPMELTYHPAKSKLIQHQLHLYLCSPAKIKEGHKVLLPDSGNFKIVTATKHNDVVGFNIGDAHFYFYPGSKKIEFTSDDALIKEGVKPLPEKCLIDKEDTFGQYDNQVLFMSYFVDWYNKQREEANKKIGELPAYETGLTAEQSDDIEDEFCISCKHYSRGVFDIPCSECIYASENSKVSMYESEVEKQSTNSYLGFKERFGNSKIFKLKDEAEVNQSTEVKGVDVEKLADEHYKKYEPIESPKYVSEQAIFVMGFEDGYAQALQSPKLQSWYSLEDIINYIENDSECLIPIEKFFDEKGNGITKKEYGKVLLKELCKELRVKFIQSLPSPTPKVITERKYSLSEIEEVLNFYTDEAPSSYIKRDFIKHLSETAAGEELEKMKENPPFSGPYQKSKERGIYVEIENNSKGDIADGGSDYLIKLVHGQPIIHFKS